MSRSASAAIVAVIVLGAQPLWADVTPEEVWQNWQDTATAQGQKITAASTAMDGDTLIVSGITVEMTGEGGNTTALIEEMQFQDNGDGTVAVILPDTFPVLLKIPAAAGEGSKAQEVTLNVTMPDAEITASGVAQSLNYETSAPNVEISADVAGADGTAAKVSAKLTDVVVNYLGEAAEVGTNLTQDFSAATFDLSVTTEGDPDQDVSLTLSLANLGGKADMTGIPAEGMDDMPAALKAGMTLDLEANYGVGSFDISGKDAGQAFKMTGSLGGGDMAIGFDADRFAYETNGKSISLNFSGTDKTNNQPMTFSATLANTASKLELSGADWSGIEDFNAALKAGLTMTGSASVGPTSLDFAGGAEGAKTTLTAALGGMSTTFDMASAGFNYGVGAKALSFKMVSPDIPLPEAAMDITEVALDFGMPLSKSDQPAPFNMLVKLVDLNVAEAIWSMVDAGGVLPHDPATLILDTKGMATLNRDLSAEGMALEGGDTSAPGQLNALDLTQLLVKFAGAELTGAGGFTFDNSDTTTLPGIPLPTGKIDLRAVGLNGLIDKLVQMGFVPEDQAMQGRMMLSMFANTSADKDEITSSLEFKDGHFFANGQQLQ